MGRRQSFRRQSLAAIHTSIAAALHKAGLRNRALSNRIDATRQIKRGPIRRAALRAMNEYGMARQASSTVDDREAFWGIQLARYVGSKRSRRLGTRAEIDMVAELLSESWSSLSTDYDLARMTVPEKEALFRATEIVFPFLSVPEALSGHDLVVDFLRGRRVNRDDRCVCGSGLSFRSCHGRIPGVDEILIGDF